MPETPATDLSTNVAVINLLRSTRSAEVPTVWVNKAESAVFQCELPSIDYADGTLKAEIRRVSGELLWGRNIPSVRPTIDGDSLFTVTVPPGILDVADYVLGIVDMNGTRIADYRFRVVRH